MNELMVTTVAPDGRVCNLIAKCDDNDEDEYYVI